MAGEKPAARITDLHVCPESDGPVPHVGGPIIKGDPTVLIGGLPAARVGDQVVCVGSPDTIVMGSPTVLIGGMPAARMGDQTGHGGVIVGGMATVLIGTGGVAPSIILVNDASNQDNPNSPSTQMPESMSPGAANIIRSLEEAGIPQNEAEAISRNEAMASSALGGYSRSSQGPYANLSGPSKIGPGKKFTRAQKIKIYAQNRERNNGLLKSDQSGKLLLAPQQSRSGISPPLNEAQIDHIIPRNPRDPDILDGTNDYSNAQVLSRDENIIKSNK